MITITNTIQERLIELLNSSQSFGIALNGKWGVGKTFFWNRLIEEKFLDKKTSYISLFGIENIFDIDMNFVDHSLTFLSNSTSKYGDFQIFRNKILNVIKKISQNGNKDQQIKMKKILEYLKEE